MKFEHAEVFNFEGALKGMRNPLESWAKSDSHLGCFAENKQCKDCKCDPNWCGNGSTFMIGEKDLDLAQRLIKGGPPHSKFLRQIFVTIDITAPLYWWKEMDTYKIGTTANSTSTMHKLATTPITIDCFETDDLDLSIPVGAWATAVEKEYTPEPSYNEEPFGGYSLKELEELKNNPLEYSVYGIINVLERLRLKYLETKDIRYWKELIRWLPESWLQTRTWTADYEVLRNIVHWRSKHKLSEWHQFVDFIKTLPYAEELIFYNNDAE